MSLITLTTAELQCRSTDRSYKDQPSRPAAQARHTLSCRRHGAEAGTAAQSSRRFVPGTDLRDGRLSERALFAYQTVMVILLTLQGVVQHTLLLIAAVTPDRQSVEMEATKS
jgi:hypothetical protein